MTLRRYQPLRTKPKSDPVTPALYWKVRARDGYRCVAPLLGATDPCRYPIELDHVKDEPRMGKRAPSTERTLASICGWHHRFGWATANRPALREYLRTVA